MYSSSFPITIIYKSEKFKNLFDGIKNLKFVQFDNIKGEQYPVIISEYNDELLDKEIYLILSRGQFEVEFISTVANIKNKFLDLLYREQIIEKDYIDFKINQPIEENQRYDNKNIEPETKKDNKEINLEKKNPKNKKTRVHEIAKELNITPQEVMEKAKEIGVNTISASSSIPDKEVENLKNHIINSKQYEEEQKALTTKQNIEKHISETMQWQEEIDPDIITDVEQYKKDFICKINEDVKNFEEKSKTEIVKEIVVIRKSEVKNNEQKDGIKTFLQNTYKGYCQICGFTFRKAVDGQNSFEMYSWNDKRVVKNKKSFISTADSLCLCRNCSANIKWGAFEPIFLEHIKNIQNFETATIEDIKKEIHKAVDENLPDTFEQHLDFGDK